MTGFDVPHTATSDNNGDGVSDLNKCRADERGEPAADHEHRPPQRGELFRAERERGGHAVLRGADEQQLAQRGVFPRRRRWARAAQA